MKRHSRVILTLPLMPAVPRSVLLFTALLLLAILLLLAVGCRRPSPPRPASPTTGPTPTEHPVQPISLNGPLADPAAEISGLTWHGDWLLLLPQYPRRGHTPTEGRLYAIARARLEQALADTARLPITPRPIPLRVINLDAHVPVFQGFEAMAVIDGQLFILVESTGEAAMRSYLVRGRIDPDARTAHLEAPTARPVPMTTTLPNMSQEALFAIGDTLVTLHEANGANVNPTPQAHRYTPSLQPLGARSFPTIEYRITDATAPDSAGHFWAMNYFFPGERDVLQPAVDSLALHHGTGASHRRSAAVERLIPLRYTADGIRHADAPPIPLALADRGDGAGRNWEGLARMGTRGFLVATDRFPGTLLAFVPLPDTAQAPTDR